MGKHKVPEAEVNMKTVPRVNKKHSTKKTKTRVFDKVPNEIFEKILAYLPLEAKKSARLVSSRWKAVLNHCVRFSIPLTNTTLPDFEVVDYRLNELRVVLNRLEIPTKFSPMMKRSFQTANALYIMADDYAEWNGGAGVGVVDGKGVERIFKTCQRIHTLKLDFAFMVDYRLTTPMNLRGVQFEFLETLKIRLAFGNSASVEFAVLRLKMPRLHTLEVERFDLKTRSYHGGVLYHVVLECLARNRLTLKVLKLVRLLTTEPPIVAQIERSKVFNELTQMSLESLEIRHKKADIGVWGPAGQLLNNLRSLRVLKIHTDCGILMELTSNLIANNGTSLTTLELNVENPAEFNLDLLTALSVLTDFSFTCKTCVIGFFPPTLKTLTWDSPLSLPWHHPLIRVLFPNLTSLILGPLAMTDLALCSLCLAFFGTRDQRTNVESITLLHKPIAWNDRILRSVRRLQTLGYTIKHGENFRITLS